MIKNLFNSNYSAIISKAYEKKYLNTILLFLYVLAYNWLVFGKEEGFHYITFVLLGFFTFLVLLLLNRISVILYNSFLVLCVIIFIPLYIANEFVGGLSSSHFMAFFLTDVAESASYFKIIPKMLLLQAFVFILISFYFFKANIVRINRRYAFVFLAGILFYTFFKFWKSYDDLQKNKLYIYKTIYVSPFRVIARSATMYMEVKKELVKQKELMSVPDSWNYSKSSPKEEITIVIIGESVRKDFMQIYNPSFKTTPFLKSVSKIQFNNATSYAFQTLESLSYAFMTKDEKNIPYFPNNIISLSKKAGFEVNWISNQGAIGIEDNFIAAMGKQSNYSNFVSKGRWNEHVSDDKMLDVLQTRLIIKSEKPKVFFMHMIGSHPDPCDITNGEYKEFIFSKNISCYIESVIFPKNKNI